MLTQPFKRLKRVYSISDQFRLRERNAQHIPAAPNARIVVDPESGDSGVDSGKGISAEVRVATGVFFLLVGTVTAGRVVTAVVGFVDATVSSAGMVRRILSIYPVA